jgi:ribosomal protein S18 acetylase RimI-like enzyme
MSQILKLRPARPDDEPFLRELKAQLDTERLGIQYWGPGQEETARKVIELQFRGHAAHYAKVKANWETKDNIVELDGTPVGRFILAGGRSELRLCDIAIDRAHRGMGLGKVILDSIKNECARSQRPLRLHVDRLNNAFQFYVSQGFRVVEDVGTHYKMEWNPSPESGRLYSFAPAP